MSGWDDLLVMLAETPRENGTAALHRAAEFLRGALEAAGLDVTLEPIAAAPYRLRLAGVVILAGMVAYWRLVRAGRSRAALVASLLLGAALLAELEFEVPVWGWVGAETQHVVVARVPAQAPERVLAFAAHYDSKTDLLDHVERAPVDWLGAPLLALLPLGALALAVAQRGGRGAGAARRFAGALAWVALVWGGLAFASLSAGAFVPRRSPGALDDGAACAVLVRLAGQLAAEPLARTEVEVWLFPAEEVGVQGSSAFAAARFAAPPALPTSLVNLEGLGASADHALISRERFLLRSFAPDAALVNVLDRVHAERFGRPLGALPFGGATDARSFLARGVPAATLMTLEAGTPFVRDLHSARDSRERIDEAALDASLAYLLAVARAVDANRAGPRAR
jgi:hypothetical protein